MMPATIHYTDRDRRALDREAARVGEVARWLTLRQAQLVAAEPLPPAPRARTG